MLRGFITSLLISCSLMIIADPLLPHCFLAVRDLDPWLELPRNKHVLDYGTGNGDLLNYVSAKGFIAQGVDISEVAIEDAMLKYPELTFQHVEKNNLPFVDEYFDLVLSNFVLSDLASKTEMVDYLKEAGRVLNQNGILIAFVFDSVLYNQNNEWGEFSITTPNPKPTRPTQLLVHNEHISDSYYWEENDYKNAIEKSGLNICSIHYPKGNPRDAFNWRDERKKAPVSAMLISRNCSVVLENGQRLASLKHYWR